LRDVEAPIFYLDNRFTDGGKVVSLTRRPPFTPRKVAVSSPDDVHFFNLPNPSSRTMALWSTQPLTKMSTRNLPWGWTYTIDILIL
jgi:hypothetical protein